MDKMDALFRSCTLDYFKTGAYRILLDDFLALKKEGKAMMLDLRFSLLRPSYAHCRAARPSGRATP